MKLWITTRMTRIYRLECSRCNCYLIVRAGHYILVDTGIASERKKIVNQLERIGVHKLDAIFLTHVHTDHAENASYLKKLYHTKIYMHEAEKELFEKECGNMSKEWVKDAISYPIKTSKVGRIAKVRKIGKEDGFDLLIMETKGHTEGSVSILVDHEVAIVGDAMVHNLVGSIFPQFGNEEEEVLTTWRKLLSTRCKLYLPGHGRSIKRRLLAETYSAYKDKHN